MKFAFLLYEAEDAWAGLSEAERREVIGEHMAYVEALARAGAMVAGEPLSPAHTARTLRAGRVQDGPYADTKEQLGGFYVIEADSMDAALDWARRCPAAKYGIVEVRPVPDYGG